MWVVVHCLRGIYEWTEVKLVETYDDCLIITNNDFLKTYLRSAMNVLETLLLSERKRTSNINLEEIVDNFASLSDRRIVLTWTVMI